jgi:hypothetical protein
MPHYTCLIVGGGMTGDAAIHGIREVDRNGSIGLIGAELHPPYNRPPLSKGLWKGDPLESIWRQTDNQGVTCHPAAHRRGRPIPPGRPQGVTTGLMSFPGADCRTGWLVLVSPYAIQARDRRSWPCRRLHRGRRELGAALYGRGYAYLVDGQACAGVATGDRLGALDPVERRGRPRAHDAQGRPGDHPATRLNRAYDLGRARSCAHRVAYGHAGGHALQPADQNFLRAAPRGGESQKSRPDGVHAYVSDHAQCHTEAPDALASTRGPKLKKYTKAPLTIKTVAPLLRRCGFQARLRPGVRRRGNAFSIAALSNGGLRSWRRPPPSASMQWQST